MESPEPQALTPDGLACRLRQLGVSDPCWLALSGGLDSSVLLHLLCRARETGAIGAVAAVHVHHGLSTAATDWARHCESLCAALQVPFHLIAVDVERGAGLGLEGAAREARYQAFSSLVPDGESLLLAHHRDDQAETVLLRLLRGAGPGGLAAMRAVSRHHGLCLLRPLLDVSRAQLEAYARAHALHWVEDESNTNLSLDRNFLRQRVMPVLRERWPQADEAMALSARHCAMTARLAGEQLDELLGAWRARNRLPLAVLDAGGPERRLALLRHWLESCGLPAPGLQLLQTIDRELLEARPDAAARLTVGHAALHRYGDCLYLLRADLEVPEPGAFCWQGEPQLQLPGNGKLVAHASEGSGVRAAALEGRQVRIAYRQGGERLHPFGRSGSHPLKKLLQECRVPPWLRDRLPLIRADGAIVAVAGLFVCQGWEAGLGEPGIQFEWQWSPEHPVSVANCTSTR